MSKNAVIFGLKKQNLSEAQKKLLISLVLLSCAFKRKFSCCLI